GVRPIGDRTAFMPDGVERDAEIGPIAAGLEIGIVLEKLGVPVVARDEPLKLHLTIARGLSFSQSFNACVPTQDVVLEVGAVELRGIKVPVQGRAKTGAVTGAAVAVDEVLIARVVELKPHRGWPISGIEYRVHEIAIDGVYARFRRSGIGPAPRIEVSVRPRGG